MKKIRQKYIKALAKEMNVNTREAELEIQAKNFIVTSLKVAYDLYLEGKWDMADVGNVTVLALREAQKDYPQVDAKQMQEHWIKKVEETMNKNILADASLDEPCTAHKKH